MKKIEVQGHRGARALLPENTMAGFEYALHSGVDAIELDIWITKDNIPVVVHDAFINPQLCLSPRGEKIKTGKSIRSLTLTQLKKYDCGSLKHPKFKKQKKAAGEKIPTLEEVIVWLKNHPKNIKNIQLNIELKSLPALPELMPSVKSYAQIVLKTIEQHNFSSRVWVQSFDHRLIKEVKRLNKQLKTSLLLADNYISPAALLKEIKADAISANVFWITPEWVKEVHKLGAKVFAWTANSKKQWDHLIQSQVNAIITDDPKALIRYLNK